MSLVVVAGNEALEARVRSLLPDPSAHIVDRWVDPLADPSGLRTVGGRSPAAVIFGPEIDKDTAFDLAAEFDLCYPAISVLMVVRPTRDTWQRAVAAGVRGLIARDASDEEFRAHLAQVIDTAGRRAEAAVEVTDPSGARVITVVSPKGGSGKTIVGTNLAVGLAARHPGEVVLVDLDLQFGDVAHALALFPRHTIADAVSVLSDLDATLLKVFLTRHRSGLHVLCAPDEPAAGEVIPAAAATEVIRLLASEFGYVIIDTPAAVGEHTRAALDLSTDVVLVCDMDVPAVRDLRKGIDLLGERDCKRHLVLNRADSRVGLNKSEVAEAMGAVIDAEIPSSAHVPISLNEGRPLVLANPRSEVARRLAEVAGWFDGAPGGPGGPPPSTGTARVTAQGLWKRWQQRVSRVRSVN